MIDITEISKDSYFVYIGEEGDSIKNMAIAIKNHSTNLMGSEDHLASKLGKRFQKQFIVCNHNDDPAIDIEVFHKVQRMLEQ